MLKNNADIVSSYKKMIKKEDIFLITKEFFYALTVALVLFFIMELVWPRMVLAYINVNMVLIFWVVSATILLASNKRL
ncbi:hypothetical protein ISS03_03590 [Patescibacteria group bacterium]|nr:hypothetical protein [Patescibacteria group bacterium]